MIHTDKFRTFRNEKVAGFGYTNGKNSTDSSDLKGENNLWTWSNIKDTIIKYAEVYYTDWFYEAVIHFIFYSDLYHPGL